MCFLWSFDLMDKISLRIVHIKVKGDDEKTYREQQFLFQL